MTFKISHISGNKIHFFIIKTVPHTIMILCLPDVRCLVLCVPGPFHFWLSYFCVDHSSTTQTSFQPARSKANQQNILINGLSIAFPVIAVCAFATTYIFTFTVSNEAPSRMTTSLFSAMRSWRLLLPILATFGSYSSKCSRPRFFPLGAAITGYWSQLDDARGRKKALVIKFKITDSHTT